MHREHKILALQFLFHPKKVALKHIQRDPYHGLGFLSFFFGLGFLFTFFKTFFNWDFLINFWASIALGFFFGYAFFSFLALFFYKIGKKLRQKGHYSEIRLCIVWSSIPATIWLLANLLISLSHEGDFWASSLNSEPFLWAAFFINLFMVLWSLFLMIESLIEIMKLTFIKVLMIILMGSFCFFSILLFLIWFFGFIFTT